MRRKNRIMRKRTMEKKWNMRGKKWRKVGKNVEDKECK